MGSEYMVLLKSHHLSFKTTQNFVNGKQLINWGDVIESKLLESKALMCKNNIDSIFPWLEESVLKNIPNSIIQTWALNIEY